MKRRLNRRGRVLITILTILLSAVIYIFMGHLGELQVNNIFYQLTLLLGWGWLFLGQFGAIVCIWEK